MAVTKKTTDQPLIIQNITVKPVQRRVADVSQWQNALRSADSDRYQQLYNLYETILIDNTLTDAINKRIEAITNSNIVFKNAKGESVLEIDNLIDTPEFEQLITEIIMSKFWGISVCEIGFADNQMTLSRIPRKHLRRRTKTVAVDETGEGTLSYAVSNCIEATDADEPFGLIYKAAPYVIYKQGNYGDWSHYAQIFGIPFRQATYSGYDEKARVELQRALDECGGGMTAVLPDGCKLEVTPTAVSGNGELFKMLRDACNEEILVCVLGQTMTTQDGSSLAQGKVHMEVQENKHRTDKRFVQRVLNRYFVPLLTQRGFNTAGGFFQFPEQGEVLSKLDSLSVIERASKLVDLPAYHVYETLGLPQPQDGEELIKSQGLETAYADPGEVSERIELSDKSFLSRMIDFFVNAPTPIGANTNHLTLSDEQTKELLTDDNATKLLKRVARGESTHFDAELFNRVSTGFLQHINSVKTQLSDGVGIKYGVQADAVTVAMETNLYHFSAAKTLVEVQQLNQLFREAKSFDDFLRKGKALDYKFNETWARTEYQTAQLTANSIADYHNLRKQTNIFPYWRYRTVGDDAVREAHSELDGVILPSNAPEWNEIYPPNDWGCRCAVEPLMSDEVDKSAITTMRQKVSKYQESLDGKRSKGNGFAVNKAITSEVFTANQMYIKKFPSFASKHLNKLTTKEYKLPTADKCRVNKNDTLIAYRDSAEDYWGEKAQGDAIKYRDYKGKTVCFNKVNYAKHTESKDKYKQRVRYLNSIDQVLREPDEIWLNDANVTKGAFFNNYSYIKYYKDVVMLVACRVSEGKVYEIKSFFPLEERKRVDNVHRRGLLIYKKPL